MVHQTHVIVHQTLPKIFMQVIGTVCQTNGTVREALEKRLMNMANNHP